MHGLVGLGVGVDYCQPAMPQAYQLVVKHPLMVGATLRQRLGGGCQVDHIQPAYLVESIDTGDATHIAKLQQNTGEFRPPTDEIFSRPG